MRNKSIDSSGRFGSVSWVLKGNRCNVDMNSKVCQQVW